jgi:acylphosphatase
MMARDTRLQVRIDGRVQGVGFRFYVRDCADQLGLSGWVRNRRDGTVEVVAEGPRQILDTFLDLVRQGPSAAVVTEVETNWGPATGEYSSFDIRPTAW